MRLPARPVTNRNKVAPRAVGPQPDGSRYLAMFITNIQENDK